jgi:hypothetical protein
MYKNPALFNKMFVIGILILIISISIVSPNCTAINELKSDSIEKSVTKEFINVAPSSNGNPPTVKILYPENGSTIYTRYSNITVKCTDDTGVTDIKVEYGGDGYQIGYGTNILPPSKIYYYNASLAKMNPGYVWVIAKAFDEDDYLGIDFIFFYYDDSNDTDLYPPEVRIALPRKGHIYFFGESLDRYFENLNFSVVFGKFEVVASIDDQERHLQKAEIYIGGELVYEREFSNWSWDLIHWDCNKRFIGMHEIKIVATDSYNNTATERLNCFIINFF